MKRKGTKSLIIILIMILVAVNNKPIGRILYPVKYEALITKYSKENNVDPYLVLAIIKTESNFNPKAKSHQNAIGLMQITPSTAKWIADSMKIKEVSEEDLFNEETSIKFGTWYLRNLYDEFNNWNLVIAAYNGGRGNVNKWLNNTEYSKDGQSLQNIPFGETDKYIKRVNFYEKLYKYLY